MTAVGLEPTTIALKVRCSTTELRGHAQAASILARIEPDLLNESITDLSSLSSTAPFQ